MTLFKAEIINTHHLSFTTLKEVGVDEGEEDEADTFDADHYVAVFLYSDDVAGIACEGTSGDVYGLVFLKIRLSEYLTFGFIIGREEPKKMNGAFRD